MTDAVVGTSAAVGGMALGRVGRDEKNWGRS